MAVAVLIAVSYEENMAAFLHGCIFRETKRASDRLQKKIFNFAI
jgi:hypothetical protein